MKDQRCIVQKQGLLGWKPPKVNRQSSYSTILEELLRMKKKETSTMNISIAMEDPILRRQRLKKRVSYAKMQSLISCKQKLDMNMNLIANLYSAVSKDVPKSIIPRVWKKPEIVTPSSSMIPKCRVRTIIAHSAEPNSTPILPYADYAHTPSARIALVFGD